MSSGAYGFKTAILFHVTDTSPDREKSVNGLQLHSRMGPVEAPAPNPSYGIT